MTAPKPLNMRAMSDAWDDPVAFATELTKYYQHLEASGHRVPAHDYTQTEQEKN